MGRDRYEATERTTVNRVPNRSTLDRDEIHAILDAGLLCHVGIEVDGQPYVLPMGYARDGERLLLHGSRGSRLMRRLAEGAPACVTVTPLDGLVLARSGFSSSMNYRSVVVLGRGRPIENAEEKVRALDRLAEHLAPGRSAEYREHEANEVAATAVVAIPLEEVSGKVRSGPPSDPEKDVGLPVWAGVLPLRQVACEPEPAPDLPEGVEVPFSVRDWSGNRDG